MNCCNCGQTIVVDIPGVPGSTGTAGQNAYSLTTADFILPAVNSDVTILAVTAWLVVGQVVFIGDGTNQGTFRVSVINNANSFDGTFLGYGGDSAPGATIAAGAKVSPAGVFNFADPVPVANGGTAGITAAAARANLSAAALGANADITSLTGLTSVGTFTANGTTPVTVAFAGITANSLVLITLKTVGGTVGAVPAIKTITPTTGFTVAATAGDTSTYSFLVFN